MNEYHPVRVPFGNKENAAGEGGWQSKNTALVNKFHSKLPHLPAVKSNEHDALGGTDNCSTCPKTGPHMTMDICQKPFGGYCTWKLCRKTVTYLGIGWLTATAFLFKEFW